MADTTAANELSCLAYAWFRSAEDNEVVPHHWVQGFEVYAEMEASTVTHRSSEQYKQFRQACAAESLLDRGSDLRYLEPLGIGFLTPQRGPDSSPRHCDSEGYVVVERLRAADGADGRDSLLALLRNLESTILKDLEQGIVATFWVLGYRLEECDPTIVVFQRFATTQAFQEDFVANESIQAIRYAGMIFVVAYNANGIVILGKISIHCASGNRSLPGGTVGLDLSEDNNGTCLPPDYE